MVLRTNLVSIYFWENKKKRTPIVWQTNLQKLKVGKTPLRTRIYLRANPIGIGISPMCQAKWEGKKEIKNAKGVLMQIY